MSIDLVFGIVQLILYNIFLIAAVKCMYLNLIYWIEFV